MLITIYKAFIRPHLDSRDVLYDQVFNNSFKEKLESIQHNACLASTRAIRVRQKKKAITNWDRSPFEIDAGAESFTFFIRFWKMKILNIYSAWSLPDACYTRLEIYIIFPLLTQNTTFSKILYSINHNWIEQPRSSSFRSFSVFKSNIFKFISKLFIIVITLDEYVILQDLDLA